MGWYRKKKTVDILKFIAGALGLPEVIKEEKYQEVTLVSAFFDGAGYYNTIVLNDNYNKSYTVCLCASLEQCLENHANIMKHLKTNPKDLTVHSEKYTQKINLNLKSKDNVVKLENIHGN